MQSEITIKNLKKYFAEIKAVDDISFTVQKGELFGFLGVNGAGKSTTIRMMCTLFSPTDGEIWIGGQQVGVHDEEIRQKIGVVWQENVLDDRLTVKENLQVRAAMYKTTRAWQKERIQTVCEKLHLEDIYTRRYAKLSGGQKRRCEIAAALLNDPEVLLELITHNLRLVVYLAKKYENSGVPAEDLVSIGTIGLIKAVNTFTPARSIKLATYASRCIGNEILMYLRKSSNRRQETSIDEPLNVDGDGNELLLSDILGSDANAVSQQLEQDAERAVLRSAVAALSARERQIMEPSA